MLFNDHFKKQFDNKILECDACAFKDCPGPVLGYGSLEPGIMFIGDVAKESDIKLGIPFTGKARERMKRVLEETELEKKDYYLTYFIKHAIPKETNLSMLLYQPCLDLLIKEIELINPRIICSMGYFVTKYLLKEYKMKEQHLSMQELHGNGYIVPARNFYHRKYKNKIASRPKRYIVPTWSPAVDKPIMNVQMMEDVLTIKSLRNLEVLLWD
jgi:uracil-DNA glycosylase family 4